MRVKVCLVVGLLVIGGMVAGDVIAGFDEAGICGGVTWGDDPDSEMRTYIFGSHQLPLLSQELLFIENDGYDIVSITLASRDSSRQSKEFECAIVFAKEEGI